MSEACPLGLNYGHFGEPSYDSENHEWHFPRQPGRKRELRLIGQPVRAFPSPLHAPTAHVQSATERARNIRDLTHQYPELLTASSLLSGLGQVSEVVDEVTSSHDPTISELLAIGEAVDSDNNGHRGLRTVSIAAAAGGAAGEAVRLVLLNNVKLGWEDSKNIRLSAFRSKGGEEGWWYGNGSPVQQLVFAEAEGRPSPWLAVRYHGAIAVFRPELRRNAYMPPSAPAASNRNTPSRLNANHIMTLQIDHAHDVPYSDVTFNPWYNQQIATIDQKGSWAVWDIEKRDKQAKGTRFWNVKKTRYGELFDGLPEGETLNSSVADGWGAILWAGDPSRIIVASRRIFAVVDITGNPRQLLSPNLLSSTTMEWILDVKRSPKDLTHVFVITTLSIFWLQVTSSAGTYNVEELAVGAKCLLSWRHFRDPEDISLSLGVADHSEREDVDDDRTTLVLLYSRLTGLTTVFTFQHARSHSNSASSASDPYLLPLPNEGLDISTIGASPHVLHGSSRISAMVLKALDFQSPQGSIASGLGQIYSESGVVFYQLSVLTNDLALSECLYVVVPNDFKAEVCPPETISRSVIAKTPAKVFSDFIVPSGYVDWEYEDLSYIPTAEEKPDVESRASLAVQQEDPYTISFEWLEGEIHDALTGTSPTIGFDQSLDLIQDKIEVKLASAVATMDTLLRFIDGSVSVLDLEKASGDFVDFLDDIKRLASEHESGDDNGGRGQLMVSPILTPKLQAGLGFRDSAELHSIYEHLIQTWIVPMSRQIPGRVRIALEKILRDIAGQICLASYAIRIDVGSKGEEEEDHSENWEAGAPFTLPVRRRTSATSLGKGKGKERSDSVPSPPGVSSHMSEDASFMPPSALPALPTPEPTPSLRSGSSVTSLASSEDPASQRLRAYANLTPQPALPTKMAKLLGYWQVGVDPAKYDGEAACQATVAEDESGDESQRRERERAAKRHKKQGESTIGPLPQPTSKRLGNSQPQQGLVSHDLQSSSQQTERAVTMSQVEPGKYGGRPAQNKKLKVKARPPGFK